MPRYREASFLRCCWPLNCLGVCAAAVAACVATTMPFLSVACSTTVACAASELLPARTKVKSSGAYYYLSQSAPPVRLGGGGGGGVVGDGMDFLGCAPIGPEFGNVTTLAYGLGVVLVGESADSLVTLAIVLLLALVPLSCFARRMAHVYHLEENADVLQSRRPCMRALAAAHLGATLSSALLIFAACASYNASVLAPLLASAQVAAVSGARAAAAGKTACRVSSDGMGVAATSAFLALLLGAAPLGHLYFLCLPYSCPDDVIADVPFVFVWHPDRSAPRFRPWI